MSPRGLALSLLSGLTKRPDVDKALLECELELIAKSGGSVQAFSEHCKRVKDMEARCAEEYARVEAEQRKAAEEAAFVTHVNREADALRAQRHNERREEVAARKEALAGALARRIPLRSRKGVKAYGAKAFKPARYYRDREQVRSMLEQKLQGQKRQDMRDFERDLIAAKDQHAKELAAAKERYNAQTIRIRQTEKELDAALAKNHAVLAEHAAAAAAWEDAEGRLDAAHQVRVAAGSAAHAQRINEIDAARARSQQGLRLTNVALRLVAVALWLTAASVVAPSVTLPSASAA